MKKNQKNLCIFVFFIVARLSLASNVPDPLSLVKIFHISNAKGVEFVAGFPECQDIGGYGQRPNCLDISDLQTLNTTFDWNNPESYAIKNTKNLYVAKIKNVFMDPVQLGTMFDSQQQFLFDIMVSPGYPIFWSIDGRIKNAPIIRYNKIATVQGPTYFYHWVVDRLPSILLMRDLILSDPELKIIIHNRGGVPGYVHQYLDLLGIPQDKRIIADSNAVYYADTVYFATPFLMEPIPKNLLLTLRSELIRAAQQYSISRSYNDNLIVIIQRREADRRISNVSALIDVIRSFFTETDYEIVLFDSSTSVSEQIQIFNNARLIIGVMASGLTNILYAKSGASVIEIHPTLPYVINSAGVNHAGNEWCWWLSSAVGLDYWVLPTPFKLSDASVTCPIDDVTKILQKIAVKNMDKNSNARSG